MWAGFRRGGCRSGELITNTKTGQLRGVIPEELIHGHVSYALWRGLTQEETEEGKRSFD